jgi:hypothetical protein
MLLLPSTLLEERGSLVPAILIGVKKPLSASVLERWRAQCAESTPPHFWQPGGGFDRNVRSWDELVREARYIRQNPVTRGLVGRATDWAWSSAGWFLREGHARLEIEHAQIDGHDFPGFTPRMFLGE